MRLPTRSAARSRLCRASGRTPGIRCSDRHRASAEALSGPCGYVSHPPSLPQGRLVARCAGPGPIPGPLIEDSRFSCPDIRLIGVGGAGCNVVSQFRSDPALATAVTVIDLDAAALRASGAPADRQILLGLAHGLGSGGVPEVGRVRPFPFASLILYIVDRLASLPRPFGPIPHARRSSRNVLC
jgi:hypothetical protein